MFGLLILVISAGFFVYSYQYHGMAGEAGPGMFPRMIACVTGIISVILMIGAFVGEKKPDIIEGEKNTDHKVFWCSLVLVALYVITWKYVPFMIRTEIFLLAMSWVMKFSKKFAIIYSTVFTVAIYLIFANIFRILL